MSINEEKTFSYTIYKCSCCGYKTFDAGNSSRHKKSTKCSEPNIRKESRLAMDVKDVDELVSRVSIQTSNNDIEKNQERDDKLHKENEELQLVIRKLRKELKEYKNEIINDEEDDTSSNDDTSHPGIVYYIIDKDVQTRAKIGRTTNTDVKKLKSRYSVFGDPFVICCHCDDIRKVEKELKERLRLHDCMNLSRGKESVIHSDLSLSIFLDVVKEYEM